MFYPISDWDRDTGNARANHPYNHRRFQQQCQHAGRDGNLVVRLDNEQLWDEFNDIGTEMIVTRSGRRMFPSIKVKVEGMKRNATYMMLLDVVPADDNRYRFLNSKWSISGAAESVVANSRMIVHSDSPALGSHWMSKTVSFHTAKITNNIGDKNGNIILNSMQKYIPRIHIAEASDINELRNSYMNTFTFEKTFFIAVTAYQNERITQLKIDKNPFAKGFRKSSTKRTAAYRHHTEESNEEEEGDVSEVETKRPRIEQQTSSQQLNNSSAVPVGNGFNASCLLASDEFPLSYGQVHNTEERANRTLNSTEDFSIKDSNFLTDFFATSTPISKDSSQGFQSDSGYNLSSFSKDKFYSSNQDFCQLSQQLPYHPMPSSNLVTRDPYTAFNNSQCAEYSSFADLSSGYHSFNSSFSSPPRFVLQHLEKQRQRQLLQQQQQQQGQQLFQQCQQQDFFDLQPQ